MHFFARVLHSLPGSAGPLSLPRTFRGHGNIKRMKRTLIFGILALLVLVLAQSFIADAGSPAKKATPTAEATKKPKRERTRTPKVTPTAEVAATPAPPPLDPEAADEEDAAEISPTAPGAMTSQILVFNPDSSGAATVQIDIYNTAGVVAYTTVENVAKNGAKLITLPSSLGSNFQGGAQISSDKNVQAIAIGANANKTARDSYEGAGAPSVDVALPFVRHLTPDTQNTIIAIQNTTGFQANVTLTLYDTGGLAAKTQPAVVDPHQVVYFNTNSLFPNPPFLGSARVTSDQNVAVAMQSLYYKDTSAFLGMNAGDTDTIVFLNQAQRKINGANVPTNWSEIFVRNNSTNNPTDVTVEFYTAAGAFVTSHTISGVPANGMAQFLLNDLNEPAYSPLGSSYSGWAKITSSGEKLAVSALQVLNKGKRLYGGNGLAGSNTSTRYFCGDADRTTTQTSRISILNTESAATAKVQLFLYNPDTGAKILKYKTSIAPNAQADVLLSDAAFAAAGSSYQGMAMVRAQGTAPAKLIVTVSNPYGNPKLSGTTGYNCTGISQ